MASAKNGELMLQCSAANSPHIGNLSQAEQLAEQSKLIDAQQRRFDLATARYRQGDIGYLDVLSAQQDLYSAQQSQLETRLSQLASQISLYQALGGGWK